MNADPVSPRPLPHRKLVAYQVAVELLRAVLACSAALCGDTRASPTGEVARLADRLVALLTGLCRPRG